MGNSRKEATIVGVVVFAAFLVVLWTIFYLQGFVARRNKNFYSARFEQVGLRDLIKQGVTVVDRTILVLEDARKLVARLDTMLGAESSFAQTLENVEVLTANTRDFSSRFDHYGSLLEETMSSLDSAALGFRSVVDDNAQSVQQAIAGLEDISMRLDTLLVDIESGRGALGRMLKDERLYEELRQTALEARNLIREIREHPDKYIKLDVF